MKTTIRNLITSAFEKAVEKDMLTTAAIPNIEVEVPKVEAHGDFSTNIAMVMASIQKMAPRKIAEAIIAHLDDAGKIIAKTEIAGPGFINFFVKSSAWIPFLRDVHEKGAQYGASNIGKGHKIQVEFVSSNPTGPLHVGHGRGAAYGAVVADLLDAMGFEVHREYYVNDAGRQMDILAARFMPLKKGMKSVSRYMARLTSRKVTTTWVMVMVIMLFILLLSTLR